VQQFVVPQFIDVEDKIIGPITTRQFVILIVTGLFIFLSYRFSDFSLFIVLTVIWAIIGGSLAFWRVNGRPFHFFLLNLIQTFRRPRLRIWNKRLTTDEVKSDIKAAKPGLSSTPAVVTRTPPSSSRLSDLALVVDTGGVYRGESQ